VSALTVENVRRLDALNLIEAISKQDQATAVNILTMYAEADRFDDPEASHHLARCLAFAAGFLLRQVQIPDPDAWLAAARRHALSDDIEDR
jgi:hypothetical protein